jgi:citronellol/citronellal dehydrogenase
MQIDIRDDAALRDGVAKLAEHFGGIDILVNNASAISLSGIADTPMKRFDLMLGVNVRGTFAASQACIPYLKKAANPHVLTISPPLSAESRWFGRNAPHAISKFGMTMVAVGLAEELKEFGVASNALWPRALIDTDAVRVFFTAGRAGARKPELMADAAHTIVTKDSRQMTGHALLAEEVLAAEGVIDLTRYEVTPGASVEADLYVDQPVVALRTER